MDSTGPTMALVAGDNDETKVIAEYFAADRDIRFLFEYDEALPKSQPCRIFACYHELEGKAGDETLPHDRVLMRETIGTLVKAVWPACSSHPAIQMPDAFVKIYEDKQGQVHWRILHESLFSSYVETLLPVGSLRGANIPADRIENSNLVRVQRLGGRGSATLVRESPSSEFLHVFKGIEFVDLLTLSQNFFPRRDVLYHEIRTLCALPPAALILSPPVKLVTVKKISGHDTQEHVCGMLLELIGNGTTLEDEIERANKQGTGLALKEKAKWCWQMASAVHHTHRVAKTYHMDIKPGNFVFNIDRNLFLIDWEQHGAPACTIAPEADGTWDVEEAASEPSNTDDRVLRRLRYHKYTGPPRQNEPWNWPTWNVFPIWQETNPRALEAAEVFSLGRTMWMLLQQLLQEDVGASDKTPTVWQSSSNDIPDQWRNIVNECNDPDPNKRPRLEGIVGFWEKAWMARKF